MHKKNKSFYSTVARVSKRWSKNNVIKFKGYKFVYVGHCLYSSINGWVAVHRYVVKMALGKELKKGEHVHHLNGNTIDNRIENLCVMKKEKHESYHRRYNNGTWNENIDDHCVYTSAQLTALAMQFRYNPPPKPRVKTILVRKKDGSSIKRVEIESR